MVGRDVAAVHHQLRIAVGLRKISENLVVSAILLDDEEDVFDAQRTEIRDTARAFELGVVGSGDFARARRNLSGKRCGNFEQRSFIGERTECALAVGGVPYTLDIHDEKRAVLIDRDGRRKPASWN